MDVEVNTGREGTWRSTATEDVGRGGAGMEVQVVPLEMYDSARAKIAANLRWLFGKTFGPEHIPTDLQDPFYTDQYEQEHIKPPIIRLLLSSELYCSVCGLILQPEHAASLQSHQSVIQALSRKGVFVLEDNTLVSELDLSSAPIKMSSHIHLIDALMMAYTLEMISIQKVVSSVKRFANFSDSKELPFDLEEAMVFWINKVNVTMSKITQKELKMKQHLLESPSHQKVRYRRDHSFGRSYPHFPLLDNLSNYVCNGTALLAVIHFYCPELIRLEDICLKDVSSVADSLYNIQLLLEFSNEFLKCFCLRPEDMLYSPPVLKNNVMVFIAELFWIFEVVKPDFVQPRGLQEIKDVRLLLQPKSSRPHLPFSHATKRNFPTSSNQADTVATPPSPPSSKTTTNASPLPLRQNQKKGIEDNILEFSEQRNRSSSVTLGYGRQLGTAFAWPERRQRPLSQTVPYALHFPSGEDADSISLSRSISKDSLATNFMSTTPKHMLGSGHSRRLSGHSLLDHIRFEDEEEELEEEELVAVIHPSALPRHQHQREIKQNDLPNAPAASGVSSCFDTCPFPTDHSTNSYYLEPLMPAIPKPAKEKSVSINKEEECGEADFRGTFTARKILVATTCDSGAVQKKTLASESIEQTCSPKPVVKSALRAPIQGSVGTSKLDSKKHGFFLHLSEGPNGPNPFSSLAAGNDSDSDIEDLEEDTEDQLELTGDLINRSQGSCFKAGHGNFGEGESAKLGEDLKVSERDDKEDLSGCSSPCLSTVSWPSSCSTSGSTSVKMTSFAEKKLLKLGLRNEFSSTSSSLKTTPDGLEAAPFPPWQLKKGDSSCSIDNEPCSVSRKDMMVNSPVGPSELLEIHMQLEEQRRAIEFQKKRMETFSSQQRLKLGKAAFLNIVKKEARKSDTLPLPLKRTPSKLTAAGGGKVKTQSCKDDSCLEALKMKARDNRLSQDTDLSKCSHSVELLNAAITSIQQQMMQLSLQQDMLFKHSAMSAPESNRLPADISRTPNTASTEYATSESTAFVVNFVDSNDSTSVPARRPPKLRSSQYKASDRKQNNTAILGSKERSNGGKEKGEVAESCKTEQSIVGRVHDDINQYCARDEIGHSPIKTQTAVISSNTAAREEESSAGDAVKEAAGGDESTRMKAQLIEVDLSEIREPLEDGNAEADSAEGEQKNALGFFFKEDEKADEMEKRRAAFLLKLQRKAEEAKLRKQQQEVDSELKRDEARRKAEEERIRKEEEKARRELIKQEYLRKKQRTLMEEQGLVKPQPRIKSRNSRPKSIHREDSKSLSKGSNTPDLSCSYRGSTLSLATDAESVIAVETESQRAASVCSMEFPVLSRTSSRNLERDWENGSIASSITSTEYTGPKLFKEPSSKSNKPIIINAIAHCCLAGKVNETQKNVILEMLDKCESNHLFILFRDGGCQFRAIYSYSPDNEEIIKITGTGPRNISQKMIDKLFKYSSDRKLFTVIHTKTVSVSVDALTIHNHLWHVRRPGSARRK